MTNEFSSFLKFSETSFLRILCFKHSFRFSNFDTSRTLTKEIYATIIVILNSSGILFFIGGWGLDFDLLLLSGSS